ncbi:coproporphyrinogen dehydrogenase HemZ [Lacrimispora sp. NSJ-141]|uniref:Coproporphyrinogen dehydrogenase HemZ n=1 Tax=Lientehia hominis TaxID=2897778 RepID=A0AAP2W6Y9_9FIRM|nr:coproporphyrinogen dehydrogenase HemZ [Lientehia hominis]MCD2491818.1 coproporphyrinogen dehydrogenase HemZ [Lientehia hominis]
MICLILSEENFEYDVRGLLTAFYPGEEICASVRNGQEGKLEPGSAGRILSVDYMDGKIRVSLEHGEKKAAEAAVDYEDRKETKSVLKRLVYGLLSADAGRELPWGTLTGIRPTKIPMALLEEGADETEIVSYMKENYLASEEKIRLSIEIAKREKQVLKDVDYEDGYSLYIGIPFCPTTCLYCSFTSYPVAKWEPRMDEYLDALFREIDYTKEAFSHKKLNTVYIGGGTPTTLSPRHLERLLSKVEESFSLDNLQEWTVEAGRPDSVTRDKLRTLRRHPVSRISINPQTMRQETLKIIGRHHTPEQIEEAFAMAREEGFDNINMDLIMGLPEEGPEDVQYTMERLYAMAPDNITVHSLAVKRAARLNIMKEQYAHLKFENTGEMMGLAAEYCERLGLEPYYLYRQKNMAGNFENVGYASPGKAGIYNILIMEEKQTIMALGAGSTTKAVFPGGRIERCDNVKDIDQYLGRIDEMIDRKRKLLS